MRQRIGTCSICGGDVMGWRGPWGGYSPPPPDQCCNCGAVLAKYSPHDILPMVPMVSYPYPYKRKIGDGDDTVWSHETVKVDRRRDRMPWEN